MAKKKTPDLVETGQEIVKKKPRGVSKDMADGKWLQTEPGDNTRIVQTSMKFFDMPKVDLHDPEAIKGRLAEYFQIYAEADLKPTVAGMAMALGVNRRLLWAIANDQPTGGAGRKMCLPDESTDLIKKAYDILETAMENYAASGKINPVMAIFMMKNHWNYQDKTEYVLTPNQKQESDYNADEITKRYLSDSTTINADS